MTAGSGLGADRYLAPAPLPTATTTTAHELKGHDGASVSGLLRVVPGASTVAFLMHPRQDFSHHVLVPELLSQGFAVWTQGTRNVGNDLTLLHEQALIDMAAGHTFLRESGFESIVSVGHSGGGALAAYYIEQASLAPQKREATTPGGKTVPLPDAVMPLPNGLMLMAPHPGQGVLLSRLIDPSVTDETNPMSLDPDLNAYSPANGFVQPPHSSKYDQPFTDLYRRAQHERIARIDAVARERITETSQANARFARTGGAEDRREALAQSIITVYRTDADLRCVDLTLDRNERPYGSLFGRRPDLTNYGVLGFGRLTTPEAWLSTWSCNSAKADLLRCAPSVRMPTLLVELTGDQACFPVDAKQYAEAFGSSDVQHVRVPGRHFGAAIRKGATAGATLAGAEMTRWLANRFAHGAQVN